MCSSAQPVYVVEIARKLVRAMNATDSLPPTPAAPPPTPLPAVSSFMLRGVLLLRGMGLRCMTVAPLPAGR
jgi:hypothetical protein